MAVHNFQASSGRRYIVQQFAAHLAHLLNNGDECVEIKPFALFQTLTKTLASSGSHSGSNNYRDHLLGYNLVAADAAIEYVAQKYFDAVLDRALFIARSNSVHTAHILFETLCRRGQDAWKECKLERNHHIDDARMNNNDGPRGFSDVSVRLGRLPKQISPGNPALSRNADEGPIYLAAADAFAEVAEEMSVWGAISCCPEKLEKLENGPEFNKFCSLVIKTVEAANAPYGAIISLGLSPFDWADEITINTAKKISAFIHEVNSRQAEESLEGHEIDMWRRVWEKRKIPGYKDADAFWESSIGRHLRAPTRVQRSEISLDVLADKTGPDSEFLDENDFEQLLKMYVRSGDLSEYDAWFLRELYQGTTLSEIEKLPNTRQHFRLQEVSIADYAEKLRERMAGILDAVHVT